MRVCFVGAGVMGTAIAQGATGADRQAWDVVFYDPNEDAARSAAQAAGGSAAETILAAVEGADLVVLAVKPQVQASVIRSLPPLGGATLVSIAAGRSLADIAADLRDGGQERVATVRVMPNLNALVGHATSALCWNDVTSEEQAEAAVALFDAVGTTQEIPEKLFPAFTAMAGSSPAWFFQVVDDLARAGVKHGLTKSQAATAACSAMLGSAALLANELERGGCAADLVDRVCSPGGTTIAGLLAAQAAGLGPALVAAVDATVRRDRELGA